MGVFFLVPFKIVFSYRKIVKNKKTSLGFSYYIVI